MSDATETINKWTKAATVLAVIYTVLTLLFVISGGSAFLAICLGLCAVLLWAGVTLTKQGSYVPAQGCLIVAGVIGLPLGVIAIMAGINIKKAGDAKSAGSNW